MNMNHRCGVSQLEMHPTKINQEFGYLGSHERIIDVGYEQHMLFKGGINVTFQMTPQQHVATKFTQCNDPQLKDNTRAELLGNLKITGVDISTVKGRRLSEIKDILR